MQASVEARILWLYGRGFVRKLAFYRGLAAVHRYNEVNVLPIDSKRLTSRDFVETERTFFFIDSAASIGHLINKRLPTQTSEHLQSP
jgi:hypothetical protein